MRMEALGEDEDEPCSSSTTSSSSSIGKDSDVSSETESGENENENEAQSAFKYNGSLDMMDSLQQVLPIRRGISTFYNGKSKSFTSLADAATSPSVKDIAKPENAYSRRRRNMMAFNHVWEKNRNLPLTLRSNGGGISKRTISSSRSAVALAFAINYDSSSSCTSDDSTSSSNPRSPPHLPPLHPRNRLVSSATASPSSPLHQNFSPWRTISLADLQNCATLATIKMMPNTTVGNEAAHLS
ncbi:protein OXIDATIVE STRESS 3 LIKE 1 [Gastrolobium bilobum]|uniref:protein OXIDATIVE STRESS 3 LIKE 1 n=1 Tax=Gastrolobium bilobum TaxID=150636 RepID=UPI002AB27FFA|nr:protein OXIDATIVE STRESS 3 LIKE 1 [Gastrolobium bilobum]